MPLRPKEFDLLARLAAEPGAAVSREDADGRRVGHQLVRLDQDPRRARGRAAPQARGGRRTRRGRCPRSSPCAGTATGWSRPPADPPPPTAHTPGVRRRIVVLAVLAAVLATSLFGVPLAYGVAQFYLDEERTELERVADVAAIAVAADLARGDEPARSAARRASDIDLALYDERGAATPGPGPRPATGPTMRAFSGIVASENDLERRAGGRGAGHRRRRGDGRRAGGQQLLRRPPAHRRHLGGHARPRRRRHRRHLLLARRQARPAVGTAGGAVPDGGQLGGGNFGVRTAPSGIPEIDAAGRSLDTTAARLGAMVAGSGRSPPTPPTSCAPR